MKTTFKTLEEMPVTLQANHVADALGLSKAGAYNLMNRQDFPSIRIGKRIVVVKTAFASWLENSAGKQIEASRKA